MIMKQTVAIVLTHALLSASALAGPPLPMAGIAREARVGASDFRLFDGTHTADVVVDGADSKTVKLAAGLFCDDIGRIGGTKARFVDDIGKAAADCVIVGSMNEWSGVIYDEARIRVSIDWDKAPKGRAIEGRVSFDWSSAIIEDWQDYKRLSEAEKAEFRKGCVKYSGPDSHYEVVFSVFNPATPTREEVRGHVESHGYISIEAEHYTRKIDAGGGGWELVDGLGRSGASITVLPPTLASVKGEEEIRAKSPCVEYDLYAFTTGNAVVRLNCIPSNPITRDHGGKVAIALDDQAPRLVTRVLGKSNIDNLMSLTGNVGIEKEGQHVLKVWMVDPGVTIDKIIMDMGGVKDSYLGPPESYSNQPPQ
jgi:hypothetical protein